MLKTVAFYPGSDFPPPGVSIGSSSVNILIQRDCSNSGRKIANVFPGLATHDAIWSRKPSPERH